MEDTPATTFDRFEKSRRTRTVCLAAGCLLETSEIGKDANMDKSARMALEQVCEEEVANQHVQVQERREFAPLEETATRHPADLLLSGSVSQMVSFMQAMADRFTASVQAASQELMIRVESSSSDASEFPSCNRIQSAKALFEKRVLDATNQMEAHRQWLADEFRDLHGHWYGKVIAKVVQSEAGTDGAGLTPEKMLHDQSVDLALVMRALAAQNQRRTCLKGMKLQIQDIGE
jgi:hypothetical protein